MNNAIVTPLLSQSEQNKEEAIIKFKSIQPSTKREHPWLLPFLANIFLANVAASVIQPSLAPYLQQIGVSQSYLPWTIFAYNVGGAIGSTTMGLFYDYITRICKVEGRGAKVCLLICPIVALVGSALYSSAGWVEDGNVARWFILFGRLLHGIWRGGQTSVEQAYLSTAVEPSVKIEYTATLNTFAVLGGIIGPCIGALFSQISTTIHGLTLNAYNFPGFIILVGNLFMLVQTLLFFDGKGSQEDREICDSSITLDTEESNSDEEDHPLRSEEILNVNEEGILNSGSNTGVEESSHNSDFNELELPFNARGIYMSIYVSTCFSYCFAVQETVTTPMVIKFYNWSTREINLLFATAAFISLLASISIRFINQHVQDRTLMIASIGICLLGTILQIEIPQIETILPVSRFICGFLLTYLGFPVGRVVVMALFSNILGPTNQGKWMGVIYAAASMARAITPFIAWQIMEAVNWKTWLNFGLCSLLLLSDLVGIIATFGFLIPYSEFVGVDAVSDHESVDSNSPSSASSILSFSFT